MPRHGTFISRRVKDVLPVDDCGVLRRAHPDGQSIRRIAREFGLSRIAVRLGQGGASERAWEISDQLESFGLACRGMFSKAALLRLC
jgi:hypothetical protein